MSVHRKDDGALLSGPFNIKSIFLTSAADVAADACRSKPAAESSVHFDQLAKRWILAWKAAANIQCIAISAASDAAGTYYRYAMEMKGAAGKPLYADDARMGVWPGAYLFSFSLFDDDRYLGPRVCSIDSAALLGGHDARFHCHDLGKHYSPVSPISLEGYRFNKAGQDGALFIGLAVDEDGIGRGLHLWRFNAAQTPPAYPVMLETALYMMAPDGAKALGDRVAPRAIWRSVQTRDIVLANHSVRLGDGRIGIRWYEIGGIFDAPHIRQQGVHASGSDNRWMGEIGADKLGNIALAYHAAASDSPVDIRYTGREMGDPPGMLQTEEVIVNGTGVSHSPHAGMPLTGSMSLDPIDGCTFWYVQRYVPVTGADTWRARLASFRFRSCR
jgi:hypothetical protein